MITQKFSKKLDIMAVVKMGFQVADTSRRVVMTERIKFMDLKKVAMVLYAT